MKARAACDHRTYSFCSTCQSKCSKIFPKKGGLSKPPRTPPPGYGRAYVCFLSILLCNALSSMTCSDGTHYNTIIYYCPSLIIISSFDDNDFILVHVLDCLMFHNKLALLLHVLEGNCTYCFGYIFSAAFTSDQLSSLHVR